MSWCHSLQTSRVRPNEKVAKMNLPSAFFTSQRAHQGEARPRNGSNEMTALAGTHAAACGERTAK